MGTTWNGKLIVQFYSTQKQIKTNDKSQLDKQVFQE
jgi:hypothetical protein